MSWYTQTTAEVLTTLQSREHGLTKEEVTKRLEEYGYNRLPDGKADRMITIFSRQFQSSLIYILFAAAGIVFLMGDSVDALIIFAVLFFNAIIGTIQEGKARNALLALKRVTETSATVLRNGKEFIIADSMVVPGDIIVLQEGEKVPGDARIIFANNLKIDEASLTGESAGVSKIDTAVKGSVSLEGEGKLVISDQKNMIFKGTNVLSGNAMAVVVATGLHTEIGKIAQKISTIDTEIPLKNNIKYLSRLIIGVVAVISTTIFILGVLSGKTAVDMFATAVALAVSIIPEGLPIVITLVLATGVRRMSKHNVLVKRLQAVEALGQTKVIAVDKTGTLTKNEMLVQRIFVDGKSFDVTGSGYEPKGEIMFQDKIVDPLNHPELLFVGKMAAFCASAKLSFSEEVGAWRVAGDPTEAAILVFSQKVGFFRDALEQESPKIFELSFDYRKKIHATIRTVDKKNFLTVVGAPEKVLDLCQNIWHTNGNESLTEKRRQELEAVFHEFAKDGLRVVACAMNPDIEQEAIGDQVPPLSFVGFFGMSDALRVEVKEAMLSVREAGIRVVMITGDHRLTAEAIAREADIWREGDLVITGEELEKMSDQELMQKLAHVSVFARVTPEHKLRIIEIFRKRGETVAMTGDGVNDAPSLVAADLGVAMGKIGTEVAKEASDIVLLDDNFANIVRAAEEGRFIYKTIKKVILYLFSTSVGEVLTIAGALALGYPLPLLAAQIIWLNFVTDPFLDVALAMEPKEPGLMKGQFEKPKKWIVDGLMLKRMFFMAVPMAIGTLYLFNQYIEADLTKAWSISLTTLAVFQWFNAWNCRSESRSIFQMNPFSNKSLLGATAVVVLLQFFALHVGFFQKILNTTELSLNEWLIIIPIASSILVVEEIRKFFYRRKLSKISQ